MRELLLKLHLYGGLLCSSYLLIFGLSSLNFNHHFGEPAAQKLERQRLLYAVPDLQDDNRLAEALRDTLGLIGWTLPWETYREETEDSLLFHFGVSRPGKKYTVHLQSPREDPALAEPSQKIPPKKGAPQPEPPPTHLLKIEETYTGFWSAITGLHGFSGDLPGSKFMKIWGLYTEVCVWVVLFSAASGVYLWTGRRSERLLGLILLGVGSGGALLFMLYLWRWG